MKASFSTSVGVTLLVRWATVAVTVAAGVVVARALGPAPKGIFVLAFLLLNQLTSLGTFGVPHALIYFLASRKITRAEAVGHFVVCSVGSTVILSAIYAAIVFGMGDRLFPGVSTQTLMLIALLILPTLLLANAGGVLRGLNRIGLFNLLCFAESGIRFAVLLVALVFLHAGLRGALIGSAVAIIVTGTLSFAMVRVAAGTGPAWNPATVGPLVRYGLASSFTVMLQMTERKIDMFMLGYLLAPEVVAAQVGLYSVAVSLAELPRNIAMAVSTVLLPKISAADHATNRRNVPRVSRMLIALNIAFAVVLVATAYPLIILFYGRAFAGSYLPFAILLPGVVFAGVWNVFSTEMVGTGRPLRLSMFSGFTLVLNVVLNAIAIPRWGIVGAAATSGITYSLLALLLILDYRSRHGDVRVRELVLISRGDVPDYLRIVRRQPTAGGVL